MRRFESRDILNAVLGLALAVVAVAIVRTTASVGNDFNVFWTAADAVLRGVSPYAVDVGKGMVFKYPPWVLPVFLPFALMPLEAARWMWGLLEIGSLAYVVFWLIRRGCDMSVVFMAALSFWGIWIVHALDGQVTLLLLALLLLSVEGIRPAADLGWRALLLFWASSAKIFTVFSLLGMARPIRRWMTVTHVAVAVSVFTALSLPALMVTPGNSPVTLISDWMSRASSGGEDLAGEKIRGRENQGFPVVVLRVLDVRAERKNLDILAFFLAALILGGVWSVLSAGLGFTERWVGWIALGAAVHPLAWFHSFVLAFPLAAVALDHSIKRRNKLGLALAVAGILFTAMFTSKVLGHLGLSMELASIKSWGVVLSLVALKVSAQRRIGRA